MDRLKNFFKTNEFLFHVIPGSYEFTTDVLGITMWPTNMIVDQSGKIAWVEVGELKNAEGTLSKEIDKLLKKEK